LVETKIILLGLFTQPEHRGKGYATQLMTAILSRLRSQGIPVVYLDVNNSKPETEGLVSMYQHWGWQIQYGHVVTASEVADLDQAILTACFKNAAKSAAYTAVYKAACSEMEKRPFGSIYQTSVGVLLRDTEDENIKASDKYNGLIVDKYTNIRPIRMKFVLSDSDESLSDDEDSPPKVFVLDYDPFTSTEVNENGQHVRHHVGNLPAYCQHLLSEEKIRQISEFCFQADHELGYRAMDIEL
jgi:hypothetical protein